MTSHATSAAERNNSEGSSKDSTAFAAETETTAPDMARLNPEVESDPSDDEFADASSKPSKKERVKALGAQAKQAPKRILKRLDVLERYDAQLDAEGKDVPGITDNPAFNTGQVLKKQRKRHGLTAPVKSVGEAAQNMVHPKRAVKSQAASRLALGDHPYLHPDADQDLLDAHDKLYQSWSSGEGDDETIAEDARRVREIEESRDRMRAAWITSKHVKRAKVVDRQCISFPDAADYREYDALGKYVRTQWPKYLGHMLLYLAQNFTTQYIDDTNNMVFKRSILVRNAERFFVATGPWQSWLMKIRKVYSWDDPWLTGRWLALFLVLLKTGYVMTFFYSYIVYIVVRNRFVPQSVRSIKESQERARDRSAQVLKIGELIQRHGNDKWLDPLLDDLGPLIEQQLGDLADYLEILYNFYYWRDPVATFTSLCFWVSAALASALANAEYGQKMFWFVFGFYFFFSRPIASRFPRYRKAVSIFRWIYWEVPTAAELAFRQLRKQADQTRAEMLKRQVDDIILAEFFEPPTKSIARNAPIPSFVLQVDPPGQRDSADNSSIHDESGDSDMEGDTEDEGASSSSNSEDESGYSQRDLLEAADIISFHGRWQSRTGRLIVHSSGLRFSSSATLPFPARSMPGHERLSTADPKELWNRPYEDLTEMRKTRTGSKLRAKRKLIPIETLTLVWTDGTEDHIMGMRKRDEAFNAIIGFSSGRWMQLQPRPEDTRERERMIGPGTPRTEGAERTDYFGGRSKAVLTES